MHRPFNDTTQNNKEMKNTAAPLIQRLHCIYIYFYQIRHVVIQYSHPPILQHLSYILVKHTTRNHIIRIHFRLHEPRTDVFFSEPKKPNTCTLHITWSHFF